MGSRGRSGTRRGAALPRRPHRALTVTPRAPLAGLGRRSRSEQGAVTAETAMALPLLLGVTLTLVWLVSLGITQVRAVDAAREVARALARDESTAEALALGRRSAPVGAEIRISREADTVTAVVTASSSGPGGLLEPLPDVVVTARAVAAQEQP